MSPVRRTKTKIGEILLQKGQITQEQLQEALSFQRNQAQDKRLGQILIELGLIKKEELYLALAIQSGYPYIDIGQCLIEPEVLSIIPEAMVKEHQIFPIDKMGDIITIVMANPLDKIIIEKIQQLTKSTVRVFLTSPVELTDMISKYYSKSQKG